MRLFVSASYCRMILHKDVGPAAAFSNQQWQGIELTTMTMTPAGVSRDSSSQDQRCLEGSVLLDVSWGVQEV
jgi:hypothetical protein